MTTRWRKISPTKFRPFSKRVYGFDIETYGQKNKFYCASIYYDDNNKWTFFNKKDLIDFFKTPRFKDSYVVATNLLFDFFGVFRGQEEEKHFTPIFRASTLLSLKTYLHKGNFSIKHDKKSRNTKPVFFIDTLNYAKISVDGLGKLLGVPKLKRPRAFGKVPKNKSERDELVVYNMRDSEISKKAIDFLYESFSKLGASPRITIASTSLSLFKNKYLKDTYWGNSIEQIYEQFEAYFGGRTEAIKRGKIKKYNYYDFCSLYPSVMINELPNPNTIRITKKNTLFYIENFDGISDISINCPKMDIPLLPFRYDNKLIFPTGTFRSWYSHVELRRAIELGYTITEVHKTQYFKENCKPFKEFVEDLYSIRRKFKEEKDYNPMEYVVKLCMNSLYGKFAQKFQEQDDLIHCESITIEELNKCNKFERIEDYFRIIKKDGNPANFCFPIWSLYVTAYARIKLHNIMLKADPVYVDTDSIITKKEFKSSTNLGDLELEKFIYEGIIVKPKFYAMKSNIKEEVKIKGIGTRLQYQGFLKIMLEPTVTYKKFVKLKESLRRKLDVNEIIDITKNLSLEDNKRIWEKDFSFNELQSSKPIHLTNSHVISNELLEKESVTHKFPSKLGM